MSKYVIVIVVCLLTLVSPAGQIIAAINDSPGSASVNDSPGNSPGLNKTNVNSNVGGGATLKNPLGEGTTLTGFIKEILEVITVFAVPIIVFFIIYAGFQYVMARGNPGAIEKANKALLYAIIGGVIILGANVIMTVIQNTVNAF